MHHGSRESIVPGDRGAGATKVFESDGCPPPMAGRERPKKRVRRSPDRKGTQTKKRGANGPKRCSKYDSSARRYRSQPSVVDIREPAATNEIDTVGPLEAPMLSTLFLLTGLLFFVSLLCLYYSTAFSHVRRWLRFTEDYEECRTKFCHGFSTRLQMFRREPTDLCEDIYTPMCSSVTLTYPDAKTTPEKPVWSVTGELTKQRHSALADLLGSAEARENAASNATALIFRSCLASRQHPSLAQEVRRLLTSVGLRLWPLGDQHTSVPVVRALTAQLRDLAAPFIVTLSVAEYVKDPHKPAIHLNRPELLLSPEAWKPRKRADGLPAGATYKTSDRGVHHSLSDPELAYVSYAVSVLSELLPRTNGSTAALHNLAKQLVRFEETIGNWMPGGRQVTAVDSIDVPLRQLGHMRDLEIWLSVLRNVFTDQDSASVLEVPVVSFSQSYMTFVHRLLISRSVELANYLGWRLVEYFAWSGSSKLRAERARYLTSAQHENSALGFSELNAEMQCVLDVSRLLPASSSRLYRFAVSVLAVRTTGSPWVDNETLWHAVRRVQEMKVSFGYGKVPPEESFIHTEDLDETNFYENRLLIARKKAEAQRAVVSGAEPFVPRGVNQMGITPVYDPIRNTLLVPHGILVEPFFMGATPSVHFSNAGFLIAKEMLQAILGPGQYFYEDGFKDQSWWSTYTKTNYQANKECIHFYIKHDTNFNVTDEEVTDLLWTAAALEIAFKAFRIFLGRYEDWLQHIAALKTLYTQSQLFFFGFVLNRCRLTLRASSPNNERHKEPDPLQMAIQQVTKFRKTFRCRNYTPCPFWRLEDNDFWHKRSTLAPANTQGQGA